MNTSILLNLVLNQKMIEKTEEAKENVRWKAKEIIEENNL